MSYTVQLKIHLKQFFFLVIILIGSIGTGFFRKYKVLVLVATVVVIWKYLYIFVSLDVKNHGTQLEEELTYNKSFDPNFRLIVLPGRSLFCSY